MGQGIFIIKNIFSIFYIFLTRKGKNAQKCNFYLYYANFIMCIYIYIYIHFIFYCGYFLNKNIKKLLDETKRVELLYLEPR